MASKRPAKTVRFITLDDTLDGGICSATEKEQPNADKKDIHDRAAPSPPATDAPEGGSIVNSSHPEIRSSPEDPAEEAIEQRAHEGEQISKERDHLCDDEGKDPSHSQDSGPRSPAHSSVAGHVAAPLEDAEEDESG